jgi:hypothetical protein
MRAGQAQKEAFVNEALVRLDGLVHCAIEGVAATPPGSPVDGTGWLVDASPTGEWSGEAGRIALRQNGQWLFAQPADGMQLLNMATGQEWRFVGGSWQFPAAPAAPSGGTTIDSEARAALSALIAALRQTGVFPA